MSSSYINQIDAAISAVVSSTQPAFASESANTFFSGPVSGSPATPTFRVIAVADLTGAVFNGSGVSHSVGAVPDPGATAGTIRFLREDATWASAVAASNAKIFSVVDYGATGNGVTDDTAAINAAITAALNSAVNSGDSEDIEGATVFFPQGVYLVSSQIELPDAYDWHPINLLGAGRDVSIIRANASMSAIVHKGNTFTTQGVSISDLAFDGNLFAKCIALERGKGWTLRRLHLMNAAVGGPFGDFGLDSQVNASFYECTYFDIYVAAESGDYTAGSQPTYGLQFRAGATDSQIVSVVVKNAQTACVYTTSFGGLQFTDIHGYGTGPTWGPVYTMHFSSGTRSCTASQIYCDGPQTGGIRVDQSHITLSNIIGLWSTGGLSSNLPEGLISLANSLTDVSIIGLNLHNTSGFTANSFYFTGLENTGVTIIDPTSGNAFFGGYIASTVSTTSNPPANTSPGDLTVNRLAVGTTLAFSPTFGESILLATNSTDTSAAIQQSTGQAILSPASDSSATYRSWDFETQIGTTTTANFTGQISNGWFAVRHEGTGTITNAVGMAATGIIAPSQAQNSSITAATGILAQAYSSFSNSITSTVTTARGIRVSDVTVSNGSNVVTSHAGISIDGLSAATNNIHLLIGQSSLPTGNYAIYSGSTSESFLQGELQIGFSGNTTALLVNNFTAATSSGSTNSPVVSIQSQYWNGSASANDVWSLQTVGGTGTDGTSTLTFSHTGTSGAAVVSIPDLAVTNTATASIVNATTGFEVSGTAASGNYLRGNGSQFVSSAIQLGDLPSGYNAWSNLSNPTTNLTLTMGSDTTTFNYTTASQVWTWANTTASTNSTQQTSPTLYLQGTYWTGAASATETWEIAAIASGTSTDASAITFTHTGASAGTPYLVAPNLSSSGSIRVGSSGEIFWSGSGAQILNISGGAGIHVENGSSGDGEVECSVVNLSGTAASTTSGQLQIGASVATPSGGSGATVTTNAAGGSGPAAPTVVVGYIQCFLGSQKIWLPYFE
jgi:Pectate lyase superfamily protein